MQKRRSILFITQNITYIGSREYTINAVITSAGLNLLLFKEQEPSGQSGQLGSRQSLYGSNTNNKLSY